MSVNVDPAILNLTTQLEETLTDGVAAFREGETRATFEAVHRLTASRHRLLVVGGYVYDRGRYKGTLKETDEALKEYPGTSSQQLLQMCVDAMAAKDDRLIFRQGDEDTRTDQTLANLSKAMEILSLEIQPHGAPERDDQLFGPSRGTIRHPNYLPTGAPRC